MTPKQMTALAARLQKAANERGNLPDDSEALAADLDAAADLIDSMAQRELVECTACGAEVVRVPGKYDRQNTIAADELPQILREYGRACERAAYERAVKKCEEFEDELQTHGRDREADVALGLARRIEALGADK